MSEQLLRQYIAESIREADEGIGQAVKAFKKGYAAGGRLADALLSGKLGDAFEALLDVANAASPGSKAEFKKLYYGEPSKEYRTELSKKIANDLEKNEEEIRKLELDAKKASDEEKEEILKKVEELKKQRRNLKEMNRQISYLQDDSDKMDRLAYKIRVDMKVRNFNDSDVSRVAAEAGFSGRDAVLKALEDEDEKLYDAIAADTELGRGITIDAIDRSYIKRKLARRA